MCIPCILNVTFLQRLTVPNPRYLEPRYASYADMHIWRLHTIACVLTVSVIWW